MEFLQVLVTGLGQGCLYGLIALGFVLIYKATEIVNFAQGDMLMLGAFSAVTFVMILGVPYWLGFLLAIAAMAVFGYLLDMLVIRSMIGESQFSVIILTISIGFILRATAGIIWGSDVLSLETPFSGKMTWSAPPSWIFGPFLSSCTKARMRRLALSSRLARARALTTANRLRSSLSRVATNPLARAIPAVIKTLSSVGSASR